MLCKIICHGRLTKDIKLEHGENDGVPFCQFSLASPRYAGAKRGEIVEYPDFIAYRTTAENLAKYGQKGTEFVIEAHYTSYRRNIDGIQHPVKVVVFEVEKFEFCGSRKNSDLPSAETAPVQHPQAGHIPEVKKMPKEERSDFSDFEQIDGNPDDLPF